MNLTISIDIVPTNLNPSMEYGVNMIFLSLDAGLAW